MRGVNGVGLAAQQVGVPLQVCVIEVDGDIHELVNPSITHLSGEQDDLEGCLSVPGFYAYRKRADKAVVEAQNRHGRKVRLSGTGLLSRAIQHEFDHLQGELYIDKLGADRIELIREMQAARTRRPPGAQARRRPRRDRRARTGLPGQWPRLRPDPRGRLPRGPVFLGSGASPSRSPRRRPPCRPEAVGRRDDAAAPRGVPGRPSRSVPGPPLRPAGPDAGPARVDGGRALAPELLVLADYGRIVPPGVARATAARRAQRPSVAAPAPPRRDARSRPRSSPGTPATGATLMRMDEGLDTGPIVAQRRVPFARR